MCSKAGVHDGVDYCNNERIKLGLNGFSPVGQALDQNSWMIKSTHYFVSAILH